jgi:adenylosuccinate synthase
MAVKKAYTVTDLGPGDGGKGGVVHKICAMQKPHTVIKVGGAQGSHGVRTSSGESFNFSQFGCGTFNSVRTHISDRFVVSPVGIINEANALRYEAGVSDPFGMLTIDENALCATSYHGIASRLRELARKDNPRGTVGTGVGEAFLDQELRPELALRVRDLRRGDLREVLEAVRSQKIRDVENFVTAGFLESDQKEAEGHIALLYDENFFNWIVKQFCDVAMRAKIVDSEYLQKKILGRDGIVVFESSHGVLTDRYYGFHPHASRLRTVPNSTAWNLLDECGYDGKVIKLGVTRGYQIRHGAGPMVTGGLGMIGAAGVLPEESGPSDRYRGDVRTGPLDCVALRYAVNVCGGSEAFDGLAVTWFDRIQALGSWQFCTRYQGADDPEYFSPQGEMLVRRGSDDAQIAHQETLGRLLYNCRPNLETHIIFPEASQEEIIRFCAGVLKEQIGIPVRMMSFGQTENDKVCF